MNREESPPENGKGALAGAPPKAESKPATQYGNKPARASTGSPPPTKVLLKHAEGIFLFELWEGNRLSYSVEKGEETWRFTLLFSAASKFERELTKGYKGDSGNGE